jgi:antitoxin component YwqK of YwqJK toxin-antitoxin module
MKQQFCVFVGLLGLTLSGCNKGSQDEGVVSKRYIHKYGYAIAAEDWEVKTYPGQEVTTLRSGVTVTTTYESGIQHGPMTRTYPHSQIVELYSLYNLGNKVKEISYDPAGIPVREWVQLSPTRSSVTLWYKEGSPMSVEESVGAELLDGQYYTANNELDSRVERGSGLRSTRTREGVLVAKEAFEEGYAIKRETFYPNGYPESIAHYLRGALHGEKRTFAQTGEPLAIEEWVNNQLHGKAIYFNNGNRYLEVTYLYGEKDGIERHFVDGDVISQEIPWESGRRHGEAVFYSKGKTDHEWYYEGQLVSRHKFDELNKIDTIISRLPYSSEATNR